MDHELDPTLVSGDAATLASTTPPDVNVSDEAAPSGAQGFEQRYRVLGVLGEGGMGEVRRVHDARIGREVALKRMLSTRNDGSLSVRFLREARVQGQLEHPAVVPVYDLGVDPEGSLYFTMKRVKGTTLANIVEMHAAGDQEMLARWPRTRILGAFRTLCLAIDYAHSRGVVHRDLKPANVMLGEWGEVHVLDWGIARVRGASDSVVGADATTASDQTMAGALMGTPGYMAPEQARGEHDALDGRADVYSLGAILFEILALRAMHTGNTTARLASTVAPGPEARSARALDASVAPELDAICARATALEPAQRFPSARALAAELERFLDGDRDVETRRALAAQAVRDAEQLVAQRPSEALRKLGAALALDPQNADALVALEKTLSALPQETPAEAQGELAARRAEGRRTRARGAAIRALIWLAAAPWLIAFGVQSWPLAGLLTGSIGLALLMALAAYLKGGDPALSLASDATTLVSIGIMSLIAGPLVLVPTLAATTALMHAMHESQASRRLVASLAVAVIALPFLMGELGLIAPFYSTTPEGGLLVVSPMLRLPAAHTTLFLLAASIASVITPTMMGGRLRDQLAAAEHRIFLQAWHLRHLLPARDGQNSE